MTPRFISEFGGGLGDMVTLIHWSDRYTRLETLGSEERAQIILMCHNPFAKELFLWHPKTTQFDIRDCGFWWPWEDAEKRKLHGLGPAQPIVLSRQDAVKFYPSPEDLEIIETLESFPYVVVSAGAGGRDRNIPDRIYEEVVQTVVERGHREYGLRVVTVGRTYNETLRSEPKFIPRGGIVNLIDRLSVPGTLELIARSVGVFCCFSAVCLSAWYAAKPVFLLYPRDVRDREFLRPPHQYTFGKDFKTTMHVDFDNYKRSDADLFVTMVGETARRRSATIYP